MGRPIDVCVGAMPAWLDWRRLLGPGSWHVVESDDGMLEAHSSLDRKAAADLSARLRGVGIGGTMLSLSVRPPLQRKELRKALAEEARRYRKGSKGFTQAATRVDAEGRYSLTPEALAYEMGKRAQGRRVIDACAGVGGNAIGFARAGCEVTAIEIDSGRLAMARHNAKVYGVADRIRFHCGDACEVVSDLEADLLFVDPPWGEKYDKQRVTLDALPPCEQILSSAHHIQEHWIKVPPSFDPSSLPGCRPEAVFGRASGDERRVKFLLLRKSGDSSPA
ncbi:methyltransferase domain-containing protein [Haloferula chungangensis]|uniref:Methyltransferase domain-containing protein n=1 Tax=Haloferula chungangensis TaxID=1048331 RepID=A0ABW2L8T1_9BACT